MSAKKTYYCNFCGDEYGTLMRDRGIDRLIGVEWVNITRESAELVRKHPSQVENHICRTCLNALQKIHTAESLDSVGEMTQ